LFLDNHAFEELASSLEIFCPFDAVGMERQEIRHGFFLRYILDPQRPHGFGTECLRGFMWAAAAALQDDPSSSIRPLDVHLMDLDSAIVDREYQSIDLLVQIPAAHVVIAVELKIDAVEHSGQLGRYRKVVEKEFPAVEGWRQVFLFLTKRGDSPSEHDGIGWQSLPLEAVAEMLERVLARGNGQPDARVMLGAYLRMLRRRHLTNKRIEDLARQLWREHREALDFLMDRRPGDITSEVFGLMLERVTAMASSLSLATGLEIAPDHSTKAYIRFGVCDWDKVPGMLTGTGWKPSKRMMVFEIYRDTKGAIRCQFELGPGDSGHRGAFFEALKSEGADVGGNWPLSPKWRQLANQTLASPKEDDTADEVYERVVQAASKFLSAHSVKYTGVVQRLVADNL